MVLLALVAGRQGDGLHGGMVSGDSRPEQITLLYRHRSELGAEWEDVQEPVRLSWTACNSEERPWFICPGVG